MDSPGIYVDFQENEACKFKKWELKGSWVAQ